MKSHIVRKGGAVIGKSRVAMSIQIKELIIIISGSKGITSAGVAVILRIEIYIIKVSLRVPQTSLGVLKGFILTALHNRAAGSGRGHSAVTRAEVISSPESAATIIKVKGRVSMVIWLLKTLLISYPRKIIIM